MRIGGAMFFTDYSMSPTELGRALEERGFDSLWVPEHSHIPLTRKSPFPSGGDLPKKYDMSSLRILGSVGEPINPEAWMWYYQTVGGSRCPIVDTWWQTETGGHMITPLPGATPLKPGSCTFPLPGIIGDIVIGIVGAFIGGWLFSELGAGVPMGGLAGSIFVAFIGAIVLIFVIRLIRGGSRRAP